MSRPQTAWQSHFAARKPASQWNGWFAIALFEDGPFTWLKTHAYQPAAKAHGFPVASLEGFGTEPDIAWMAGMRGISPPVHLPSQEPVLQEPNGFAAGATAWRWEKNELVVEGELLGRFARLRATNIGPQAMHWAKFTNFLHYRSLSADLELTWGDERWPGVGLVEHAWGGYLPVPALQLVPGAWQWDVFWEPGKERKVMASLSARWLGLGFVPRAFSDSAGSVRNVESTPISVDAENEGIPSVWSGTLDGESFRAERSGKSLAPFKGGAFFGFQYTMAGRRGIGFSERILSDSKRPVHAQSGLPAYSMR
jgi:hypothetical protein